MDILSDILDTLNLKGVFYFRTDFSKPWSVKVPEHKQAARFHMVVQGQLNVRIDNGEEHSLTAGDMILITGGASHVLYDTDCEKAPKLETLLEDVGYDGNGVFVVGDGDEVAKTKLVCGHFTFRTGADHPLLNELPKYQIISESERASNAMLDDIIKLLIRQVYSKKLAIEASVIRMSEVLFIELLRMNIHKTETLKGVLAAYRDNQIGRSLGLIHASPSFPWSVDSLASEVGMSRSRFAKRFRELLDMGPMTYLSEWRMQKALARLHDSNHSIEEIAKLSGYRSPAAFTRAFKDRFDVSPSKYRQTMT
jgi:AraC-like DNA-binding protein